MLRQKYSNDTGRAVPSAAYHEIVMHLVQVRHPQTQVRQIPPLEIFLQKIRLSMWPVFQKQMHMHYEAVRKLTSGTILKTVVKGSILSTVSPALQLEHKRLLF